MLRQRTCWICFAQEDDENSAEDEWVNPCRCRGATKWTHQKCVQRWIDEKQCGLSTVEVTCPQCKEPYKIGFPRKGVIAECWDMLERCIGKSCPFVAGGILVGSAYWIGVTYGAITMMQVLGHKEGLSLMERADPLFLLIGLPTIPVMLVLSRFIKWQDMILNLWRSHAHKLFGKAACRDNCDHLPPVNDHSDEHMDAVSVTRLVNGGLILPTMATLFGKLLFQRIDSNIQRSLLGGIVYIATKGLMKIYCGHQEYNRRLRRKVISYSSSADDSDKCS